MGTDIRGIPPESVTQKNGVFRAYVWIYALVITFIAVIWILHLPRILVLLPLVLAALGSWLTGSTEYVPISSLAFEQRIQNRYRSESNQLSNLGFSPLFFYGEAFPLYRILFVYPAFLFLLMLLNREVATIQGGPKLVFGFPVFRSSDGTTYSHPMQLGVKFHTLFNDGTILLTKSFGGKATYGPNVVVHREPSGPLGTAWAEHQKQMRALEATGKQINKQASFETFAKISSEA